MDLQAELQAAQTAADSTALHLQALVSTLQVITALRCMWPASPVWQIRSVSQIIRQCHVNTGILYPRTFSICWNKLTCTQKR